jgi:putative membrane protein
VTRHLIRFAVIAATIMLLAGQLPGFHVTGWGPAIVAAVVLAFVNTVIRPILFLFTLPFTIVTLGLFLFVLNAMMLWLTQALVPGFDVHGWGPLLLGSVLLSIVGAVAKWIVPDAKRLDRD